MQRAAHVGVFPTYCGHVARVPNTQPRHRGLFGDSAEVARVSSTSDFVVSRCHKLIGGVFPDRLEKTVPPQPRWWSRRAPVTCRRARRETRQCPPRTPQPIHTPPEQRPGSTRRQTRPGDRTEAVRRGPAARSSSQAPHVTSGVVASPADGRAIENRAGPPPTREPAPHPTQARARQPTRSPAVFPRAARRCRRSDRSRRT